MEDKKLKINLQQMYVTLFCLDADNGVKEYYLTIGPGNACLTFEEQLTYMLSCYEEIVDSRYYGHAPGLAQVQPVFKRYFLSDAANQQAMLLAATGEDDCAVSVVQQPPLGGGKVAMAVWLMSGTDRRKCADGSFVVAHYGIEELWSVQHTAEGPDAFTQAQRMLDGYARQLEEHHCTLADNAMRTWLYVNDIDSHYGEVVRARNAVFDAEHLTDDTHYIASTGIQGRVADARTRCMMNALAIKGLRPEQVHYLYASHLMNRTSDYGVRFERGVCIDFDGHRRVHVSGTASIDHQGNIVHHGDIRRQVIRMWENVDALLAEAECDRDDIAEILVYLRDPADYAVVEPMFTNACPSTPTLFLHAPVCRPGWLVEMECVAVKTW
jgi:enamine deaminase RidA (YjgF/YER057c/UK114 family)